MKRAYQFFAGFFKSRLAWIFFAVNWIGCIFVYDRKEFFSYLSKMHETGCKPKSVSFGIYDISGGFSNEHLLEFAALILGVINILLIVLFAILIGPSLVLTALVIDGLATIFPRWCPETFEVLSLPIFAVVNSFYWILLANMFERFHSYYTQNSLPRKNPLSIYP